MRTQLSLLVAGFVFAGILASAPADADVSWSSPGWYVEATATGLDVELISGPYSDENACKASQPADTNDYAYDCVYESSDPNNDGPPVERRLQK